LWARRHAWRSTNLENLPPSALIRELYSAGELSMDQLENLLRLLPIRNRLVHGFGSEEPIDVERLRLIVRELLEETHHV
jgi:uncharacterized protein YutE (UPF0331/DUF86 family)